MSEKKSKQDTMKAKMNHCLNTVGDSLKNVSVNSLSNTAKKKTARTLKKLSGMNFSSTETAEEGSVSYYHGASQTAIPIKDIRDGIIKTNDDRYVSVIEILPLNFYKKPIAEQNRIMNKYMEVFNRHEYKMMVQILSDVSNPSELIRNVQQNMSRSSNPDIIHAGEEYIEFLQSFQKGKMSVSRRFFYIWEYRSEYGKKTNTYTEIVNSFREARNNIKSIMEGCGNTVVEYENESRGILEYLYMFFNRNESKMVTLDERYQRLKQDFDTFNKATGKNKQITYQDLIAPKGLYFDNRNCIYQDGYYYGYLGILGDSWPESVTCAWVDRFAYGSMVDLTFISRMLPQESAKLAIKSVNNFVTKRSVKAHLSKNRGDRAEKANRRYVNNKYITDQMDAGNVMYDTGIVITVRAYNYDDLQMYLRTIKKDLKNINIKVDDGFLNCEDYYRLTMPFLFITPAFRPLKHNTLVTQMKSMYCYTSYEVYNPNGTLFGMNEDNNSLCVPDLFDRVRYKNGNMMIMGGSGAGKTYTEQLIGRRAFLNGGRVSYIIPKKGYIDYYHLCKSLNGEFISLGPGKKSRINIMEIRPEGKIDESVLDDDAVVQKGSWLDKKINNIILWLCLRLNGKEITNREANYLDRVLHQIYDDYGITRDNKSIFTDARCNRLKKMPILGDLYEACNSTPELARFVDIIEPFVLGSCSNMNGQTNVNLNNSYIVYDVDEDEIGPELLSSFMFIAFDTIYSKVKESPNIRDYVILDEVWRMLVDKKTAEQVKNIVKLIRGYGGCTIMASQELEDFLNAPDGFGKSVIRNSHLSILLNMDKELDIVAPLYDLTKADREKLKSCATGHGLFLSNDDKIAVHIKASDEEDYYINPKRHPGNTFVRYSESA